MNDSVPNRSNDPSDIPAGDFPARDFPAGDFPAGETPAGDIPAGETPAGDAGNREDLDAGPIELKPSESIGADLRDPGQPDSSLTASEARPIQDHDQQPWQHLDRRWIGLTRAVEAATWGGLGFVALIIGLVFLLVASFPFPWIVIAAWLIIATVGLFRVIWWPRWVYKHWSYRIGQKVFELRHGILWHVSVSIPLSRLQHVDLHRGPLERHRGLASLQIHTAGTKEASQTIPGLDFDVAQSLRDRLIDAANRGGRGKHASTPA